MFRANLIGMLVLLAGCSLLVAQGEAKVQSGPEKGALMPKAFECFNVNGPAKGRPHCLVCKSALYPAVLIFAAEPIEGKDEAFTELLTKLDAVAADFEERNFLVGVVILSPDARDSTNNAGEQDAAMIINETVKREKLIERLSKRAQNLKHVIIGAYPQDGPILRESPPKGYKLNPKAEITVLFYERMKIIEKYAYAPGTLESRHVEAMVKRVREALPLRKKPAEEK
jgi:hypothetical protein